MPSDYLRDGFVTEGHELATIYVESERALTTLSDFARGGRWPYEVTTFANGPVEAVPSHSTSAMNLCAMGIATGRVASPVVAPFVPVRRGSSSEQRDFLDEQAKRFDSELDAFLRKLADDRARSTNWQVSWSYTYGADDPFTLVWMLELLRSRLPTDGMPSPAKAEYDRVVLLAKQRVEEVYANFAAPWQSAFKNRPDAIEHAFPVLRVIQIAEHLKRFAQIDAPQHEQLLQYLRARLHLHLSHWNIRDSDFDAAELVFILEAMLLLDENSIDFPTICRSRDVLLAAQEKNAYWRPLRPFLASSEGKALLPLSIETANSLVRSSEILARRAWSPAERSDDLALLRRYTSWLVARKVFGKTFDEVSNKPYSKPFMGWCSEHVDELGKIHLWQTSQVLVYLVQYHAFLDKHRGEKALNCLNLKITQPKSRFDPRRNRIPPSACWEGELRGELAIVAGPHAALPDEFAVFARIDEHFMKPRGSAEATADAHYSMLFYGPQGTGKTRLARTVADCLGYPLISISPSDFMVSGDTLVEARARDIFDVLEAQIDVVILLDEIDQLILDRNSSAYSRQGDVFKLMTPGMLTKFNDLRTAMRSIFIVSTNYAERIDLAIKREGRIDDLLLILPPDAARRAKIVGKALRAESRLKAIAIPDDERLKGALQNKVLFGYGELVKLAKDVARSVPDNATEDQVVDAIEANKVKPTIQLESYRVRLKQGKQKPYDEFLMLMYLVAESGSKITQIETQLWSILGRKTDERTRVITDNINSEALQGALIAADGKFAAAS